MHDFSSKPFVLTAQCSLQTNVVHVFWIQIITEITTAAEATTTTASATANDDVDVDDDDDERQ